jgi:hypothetical protein
MLPLDRLAAFRPPPRVDKPPAGGREAFHVNPNSAPLFHCFVLT